MKEKFEKHINKIFKGIRETKEVKDIKEESKVSFILNIIPVAILRFNMPRLQIMLKYAERNLNKK